jgi:Tol biopolymer transport system component
VAALAVVFAAPAHATFPGGNGRIAYTWSLGGEAFEDGPRPRLVGVVSVRPDGGGRRLIARGGSEPAYSPDGTRIAFLRSQRLWVARAAGSGALPVTPRGWTVGQHQWSPGGTRLAFDRGFENSVRSAIYTVEPDGGGLRRLAKAPMPTSLSSGAWSPDGKAIVYGQSTFGRGLARVVRAGEITTLARPAQLPTWSSRGLIAYEAPVAGEARTQVCLTRFRGGASARCIAFAGASLSNPTWSPDGRRLMVMHTPQGQGTGELWTMRPDGTVLTRGPSSGSSVPIFSPNGRLLAYSATRFGGPQRLQFTDLFVQRPDGSGLRRLVRGGQAQSPDWQPRP